MKWYQDRHKANPSENLTQLHDLTVKMLGTRDSPALKTKGAETYGILKYLVDYYSRTLNMLPLLLPSC